MNELGIDIAWARPSIADIRSTGASWVARYFSPDRTKNLTGPEVAAYRAAKLGIVTVFESTANRAQAGFHAGQADAKLAEQQRRAVGLPDSVVHHFAVDQDTHWASVEPYFEGAVSVIGLRRTGCYGGLHVVEGAHTYGLRYIWQTVAWSGGVWAPYATIRQTGRTVLHGGADIDLAEQKDFGQYPAPAAPPVLLPQEDTMIIVSVGRQGYSDATWPGEFLLTSSGVLRHITAGNVGAFQAAGVKGPVTIDKAQYESLVAGK